jgi:hypothetical protein
MSSAISSAPATIDSISQSNHSRKTEKSRSSFDGHGTGGSNPPVDLLGDEAKETQQLHISSGIAPDNEKDDARPSPAPSKLYNKAISLHYLKTTFLEQVISEHGLTKGCSVQDIHAFILRKSQNTICPWDGQLGSGYVDSVHGTGDGHVGEASHMLCYAWNNKVGDIVDSLWAYCDAKNLDPTITYIWIDCLCKNLCIYRTELLAIFFSLRLSALPKYILSLLLQASTSTELPIWSNRTLVWRNNGSNSFPKYWP